MSRLSFRPRPLDIHKRLPIVKSFKDFEDDETPTSTRNSQLLRLTSVDAGAEIEVHPPPTKKLAPEIPTPQFVVVDTYERDYSRTFAQPNSYLRARGGLSLTSTSLFSVPFVISDYLHLCCSSGRARRVRGV